MSLKGFAYAVLAMSVIFGFGMWLLSIGEIWSQVVFGIFVAVLLIPGLMMVIFWLLLRADLANYKAAERHRIELLDQRAREASLRRARTRRSYIGPNDLPEG